ncbi:predicted protein [Chaetoceros tenuissimus]|uniref:Uncharacterized protein n=1 Tax=Chaetoceros tenuissimus TaxID=426638 RepID=A0AAD3D247_9STRA|nr:predicted protein [Chaetoceros tenuissimus]
MSDHTATASGDGRPILTERSKRVSFQIIEKENKNLDNKIDSKDKHLKFDRRRFQKLSKIRNQHYSNNSQSVATSKVSSIPEPTKEKKNRNVSIESDQPKANRIIDMNAQIKYRSLASQSRKIQQERQSLHLQKSRKRRSHETFNIFQEEEQKLESPIIVASKPFTNKSLGKANLNARRALKDLANKYNQPSPTNVTSLKLSEPSVTSTSVSTHESECGSTFIETTKDRVGASIEIDRSSKCDESIAMMTACLDNNSYETKETSLIDKVIRVSNGESMANENKIEERRENHVEDNPDILAQLTSIIGSSAQLSPDSRESHVTNSSEEESIQSYHFPYMHHEAYENDVSSVLSPLTCERNFERAYEKSNRGKTSAFRWCLLIWMFSLFLVYERCLSNEIYLISQRRRQVEAFTTHVIRRTEYHLNSTIHHFGDFVEYIKSSHMLAMELMKDIMTQIGSDDEQNSFEDIIESETEEHRDHIFQFEENEVESIQCECEATDRYFYHDMSECIAANDIDDENLATSFSHRFYQDMTICFKEEKTNNLASPLIEEHADGQCESSAIESMFYRAMTEFQMNKTTSANAFHFKPYSFSNRFTRRSYSPSPLTKMVVLYPTEESNKDNCFFNDVGANPRIDHPSDLFCKYLVPTPFGRRRLKKRRTTNDSYPRNTAFDYMTSEVDDINDVPVIEIVMEFIRRILPSGKRKSQS